MSETDSTEKQEDEPSWWFVGAIYKSLHPAPSRRLGKRWRERRVFVLRACGPEEADRLARELAESHEHDYRNVFGELVCWRLDKIEQVQELIDQDIKPGVEVYWDFLIDGKRPPRRTVA